MSEVLQRESLWRRWVLNPVLTQLTQGITPGKIAQAIAFGVTIGVFPLLGTPTLLSLAIGVPLKLNQPVLQVFRELSYPLQLAAVLLFMRAGETLFGAEHVPLSIPMLMERFFAAPGQFLAEFGMLGLYAVVVWLLIAPVLFGAIFSSAGRLLSGFRNIFQEPAMPPDFWFLTGIGALVAFVLFGLTWLLSLRLNNFSFVDVTWSYALAVIAPVYAWLGGGFTSRKLLALTMALLWSLRLGTYLFFRVKKHHPHEDVRYEVLREKWKGSLARSFFFFFQAQAVLIVLLSVPVLLACVNPAPEIGIIEWSGFAVWLIGLSGEAISDAQMKRFKADPASKGKVCQVGLWRYSRHPNYFFESVVWWGFWLFACGSPWGWATIYAPAMILYFLLRVTGIPLTEECAVQSKGDAYREYQRTTSAFVPWFPKT